MSLTTGQAAVVALQVNASCSICTTADHETYKEACVKGSYSYSEGLRSTCTTGCIKRPAIQIGCRNNDCLHIYSWPCPLINWQNIKDDKRNLRMWKLINPQETPAWLHHVSISHPQKKGLLPPPCTLLSFHLHLGQINYLPSIKGTIIFQPPSYANESTQWWDRKLVHQMVLAEKKPAREACWAVSCFTINYGHGGFYYLLEAFRMSTV